MHEIMSQASAKREARDRVLAGLLCARFLVWVNEI